MDPFFGKKPKDLYAIGDIIFKGSTDQVELICRPAHACMRAFGSGRLRGSGSRASDPQESRFLLIQTPYRIKKGLSRRIKGWRSGSIGGKRTCYGRGL
jgi:hypothetical protein